MRAWVIAIAVWAAGCSTSEGVTPASEPASAQAIAGSNDDAEPTTHAETPAEPVAKGTPYRVKADDGHSIAVWGKTPQKPRGSIVLVHGRTWSGRPDFDLQVPGEERSTMDALVREGYAAYAVDLRGYGATKRDASGWNTPDRAARDVIVVLEFVAQQTGFESSALLGWSLGSLTTQLVAQRRPELVSAAILFGYPRRLGHKYKPGPPPDTEPARAKTTAKAAAEDFIVPEVITQPAIDAFVKAALAHDPIRSDWRALDQWNELDPPKLRVPTLLLHGQFDPYAPAKNQAELFAHIAAPDREYVVVAGGDHAAHLEDTGARFVQAVVAFLERPQIDRPGKE